MALALTPSLVVVLFVVLLFGGFVTGLNGFGFAVTGTALLAALLDPQTAVVVMILPILAANASLVRELDAAGLRSCVRRFWPFVVAAVVGTVVGMAFLARLPTRPLTLALGAFVLFYVALSQAYVAVPGEAWVRGRCFTPGIVAKSGLGLVSGVVFGATNVGVQVIAYLESLDLDKETFIGVVAMVFLGIGTVRVGVAATLGLYQQADLFALSVAAAFPGLAGVAVGRRVRARVPSGVQEAAMFALLAVIGLRLTSKGLGVA
jgi:hypothetical protein